MSSDRSESQPPESDDEVFDRYARRLASLAQRHLAARLQSRVDAEDITQSAFRTFFRRRDAGEFIIDSDGDLWIRLAVITKRKAQAHARRHTAKKRNVTAEEAGGIPVADTTPSHEEAVIVEDEIERVLKDLPEQYSTILGLLLEGNSKTEVAKITDLSRMTIHRAVDVIKSRLDDPGQ